MAYCLESTPKSRQVHDIRYYSSAASDGGSKHPCATLQDTNGSLHQLRGKVAKGERLEHVYDFHFSQSPHFYKPQHSYDGPKKSTNNIAKLNTPILLEQRSNCRDNGNGNGILPVPSLLFRHPGSVVTQPALHRLIMVTLLWHYLHCPSQKIIEHSKQMLREPDDWFGNAIQNSRRRLTSKYN